MNFDMIASTAAGRETLLSHVAVTETAAVFVLDEILKDFSDPKLIKMARRHRADEVRHSEMLKSRLLALGISLDEKETEQRLARLMTLYTTLNPRTALERYLVIQVIEEQDALLFAPMADALRPYDYITADLFDQMAVDEQKHIRYCALAARELGDETTPSVLERYRAVNTRLRSGLGLPEVEVYEHARHFWMIANWGTKLDHSTLGNGLIIPGVCCGFVDGIGATKSAYFYGLRANPELPMIARGRGILRLGAKIIEAAKRAGFTHGVTSSSNPVVQRFWSTRMQFKPNGESVLIGEL